MHEASRMLVESAITALQPLSLFLVVTLRNLTASGFRLESFQEGVNIKSLDLVPSKLGCKYIAYLNKRP